MKHTLSKPAMFLFSAKNSAGLFCCNISAFLDIVALFRGQKQRPSCHIGWDGRPHALWLKDPPCAVQGGLSQSCVSVKFGTRCALCLAEIEVLNHTHGSPKKAVHCDLPYGRQIHLICLCGARYRSVYSPCLATAGPPRKLLSLQQ